MGNEVYANGKELACKSGQGKSVCAFPDVCFTPPQTPATPPGVPIPYPNTGIAGDTSDGSKTVQVSGQEVMLKDKSSFKQSTGDEAGSAPKKNVVTSKTKGKVYFKSWSMDVKIEGENVVRHMDMMTHNHASDPGGTPPWVYMDMPAEQRDECLAQDNDAKNKCQAATPHVEPDGKQKGQDCPPGCEEAKACILTPKKNDKGFCCHSNTTGHHLVEVHCFTHPGGRGAASGTGSQLDEYLDYNEEDAPCVCASESASSGTHKVMHDVQGKRERGYYALRSQDSSFAPHEFGGHPNDLSYWNYGEARDAGATAHHKAFPHCDPDCTKKQLDHYHQDKLGVAEDAPMRTDPVNRH